MVATIKTRSSAEQVKATVGSLPLKLLGGGRFSEHVLTCIGLAVLADIQREFVIASRGGSNAYGLKWPPLKPETIANRRVGPKDIRNDPDVKAREQIRKREFRKMFRRFKQSLPESEARAAANRAAGQMATKLTGQTKVQTLGHRQVDMLRDTAILVNSLSAARPKPAAFDSYSATEDQLFNVEASAVTVGTTVPYAAVHNFGYPPGNIPARQFIPRPEQIPQQMIDAYNRIAAQAVLFVLRAMLEGEL